MSLDSTDKAEHILSVYVTETGKQCGFGINAAMALENVLGRMFDAHRGAGPSGADVDRMHAEVFRTIHSLLTHASNVSRLLWPAVKTRGKKETRCAYVDRMLSRREIQRSRTLRVTLGVPRCGMAIKQRTLRDHLEHFDERLDSWAQSSERHNFAQDIIGPPNMIQGIDPADIMRAYDPTTTAFSFRGESYALNAFVRDLRIIRESCEEYEREHDAARFGRGGSSGVANDTTL